MSQKKTTIFKQLLLNILIPVFMALIVLAVLNYFQTNKLITEANKTQNYLISDEIQHILEFQDVALTIFEERLDLEMQKISEELSLDVFLSTDSIEKADLKKVRGEVGLNEEYDDLYIINREGVVVNTTFEKDLNLNFFEFGEAHKQLLLGIFDRGVFESERFTIESATRRLKKYSYQPTLDGKYIIEIGNYSHKADEIIEVITNTLAEISEKQQSVSSVDLFIGKDNPFSLNRDLELDEEHMKVLKEVFETQDTNAIKEKINGRTIYTEYIYMHRENTDLYEGSVIRIINDKTDQIMMLRLQLLKSLGISLLMVFVVIALIYKKTLIITSPIKRLVDNVNRIARGNLNERAEVSGSNEITKLSEHFNEMITKIEGFYGELEQKVKERTAEVVEQKEELEAQRDNLENAYGKIEEQNKNIMDSIIYAKRIQTAILPSKQYISKAMPDSFILYKPKDIVSGDFYWVKKQKNVSLFAAVDCTGHGVPGAFMSIVGHDQLNYAINVAGAKKPGDILSALNEGVTSSLSHEGADSTIKDGMDIALCAVDYEALTLECSGANNPIFIIRKGELIIIPADKSPIGAYIDDELHKFSNHEVKLEKEDVIYVFSDGYPDQFGGPKNKKFMSKRFKKLLIEIADKPMAEQQDILEDNFQQWRGDEEQVDDILVIGVRV